MLAIDDRTKLSGSDPDGRPGVRCIGSPDPQERIHVAVLLYPRGSMDSRTREILGRTEALALETESAQSDFEFVRGADLGHVAQILEFALEYGLTVVETSVSRRRVLLSGTASSISRAFGTDLALYEYPGGRYRARKGPIHLPARLAAIVQSVTGI